MYHVCHVYYSVRPIVGSMVEKRVSSEVTSTIVTGLKAYTNYYIVVYACIRQLCGNTSNQVIVRTQEARKLIMLTTCMSALFCGILPTRVDHDYTFDSLVSCNQLFAVLLDRICLKLAQW